MESNGAFNLFYSYPRREPKELDLISQLDLGSGYESDELDCTLKLGPPSADRGKRPRIDVPNNIHATPPPQIQNHGVANGAFGYYNISMGNVGASNMNWTPMNPNGYYYGSSSSAAVPAIPNVYNSEYARYGSSSSAAVPAIPNVYNSEYARYGSSSSAAVPAIPNVYNSEYARYQTINADMLPMRRQFPFIGNDRICSVCGSPATQLWRNIDSRGGKLSLCNACGRRFKEEERMANGHPYNGARATRAVPNGPGTPTNRA